MSPGTRYLALSIRFASYRVSPSVAISTQRRARQKDGVVERRKKIGASGFWLKKSVPYGKRAAAVGLFKFVLLRLVGSSNYTASFMLSSNLNY